MNLGARLKEEREKLHMSQPEFAEVAGAKKHAQINWEKGAATPNGAAFEAWAGIGVDVLYVITGQRAGAAVAEQLPPDEQLLLDAYRGMKAPDRKVLLAEMLTGKKAKPAKEAGQYVKGKNQRVAGRDYNEVK